MYAVYRKLLHVRFNLSSMICSKSRGDTKASHPRRHNGSSNVLSVIGIVSGHYLKQLIPVKTSTQPLEGDCGPTILM